ncbi:hypothetical protein TIFTF001_015862 [Ficus carica]|uniref:Uncharacterized protein n=1 Tax=Ficus carica TaxID=3494 RepID=A0AA88D6X9_FICCA|nr:hypothetical protein TIFTF001_015862 [Ficus carica]
MEPIALGNQNDGRITQLTPNVFISRFGGVMNRRVLRDRNITGILIISRTLQKPPFRNVSARIISDYSLEQGFSFLDQALEANRNVVVTCGSDRPESAIFARAFLIRNFNMAFPQAEQMLSARGWNNYRPLNAIQRQKLQLFDNVLHGEEVVNPDEQDQ